VRLSLSQSDAQNETGSLHLSGGGYDQTLAIASNCVPTGDHVDVVFKQVPIHASYTLSYVASGGGEYTIFQNTPFQSIQDTSASGN